MSDDLEQRDYPEDQRLREIANDPDRRMTRSEWEQEESRARQAAHRRHQTVAHDREVQQEYDRKHRRQHRHWGKLLLWFGLGALVVLLIFFIGWLPHHSEDKKAAALARQREREHPKVDVYQVKQTSTPGELTIPGTTAPLTEAYIYARANGYLKKRYVDIGDRVRQGQVLAVIDAPELDQQVDQAREQLRQAEAQVDQQQAQLALNKVTWERWRTLVAKGVFSRQDGDQREADYLAQQAVVASARRNVESYRANLQRVLSLQRYEYVTAPFAGVITQRNADVGALVGASGAASSAPMNSPQTPSGGSASQASANTGGSSGSGPSAATPSTGGSQGGAIFAISQIEKLRILVSVPEGYVQEIHPGARAQVYLQARAGQPVEAVVTRAASSLDQNTRTMVTEVDLDNHGHTLFPGMYAMVKFTQVRGTAPITVPGDAIVIRNDRTMVAVVQDSKAKFVPIEIGRDYGPSVEITSGLRAGDWVITSVTDSVQDGVEVEPQQRAQRGENGQGKAGAQTSQVPNSGPNQYGDQSITNQKTSATTQQGKPGSSQQPAKQQPSQQQK